MEDKSLKIKEYILNMSKNKRILGFNPLGISKKLKVDIKDVLETCIFLEKKCVISMQLVFNCECGGSKIGDINILGEKCEFCDIEIDEYNTFVEYKFIKN